jgi:hypothetical protein
MKHPVFITIFLLFTAAAMAQPGHSSGSGGDIFDQIRSQSRGSITFQQDSVVRDLVNKHITRNRQNPGTQGYRIRIYSDLGTHARDESSEYKTRFYENFPTIPVYRDYVRPYYKVYVGDFRTKIEAIKSMKRIKNEFPKAFIVPDHINFPELDKDTRRNQ